jgi:hypothetical protein
MVSLSALIDLHASFDTQYGIGNNLIHYLAQLRTTQNFDFEGIKQLFITRQSPQRFDEFNLKVAPMDISLLKKRLVLPASDNEIYRIVMSEDPTIPELELFSFKCPGWSNLFALKWYLVHHMDKAKAFTGFLPYGSPVVAFVNSLRSKPRNIPMNPDYADHVYLQTISNQEALTFNMPSIEINNIMYLKGLKYTKAEKEISE